MTGEQARFLLVVGGLTVGAAAVFAVPRALDALRDDIRPAARGKTFRRTVAEDVWVPHPDAAGADFLRCGSCRIEKLRRGPLTFGGLNVLVLEDLEVTLPARSSSARAEPSASDSGPSAREVLASLGPVDRFVQVQGARGRFSALRIERLSVFRLEGTDAVPFFTAARGESVREGLELTGFALAAEGAESVPSKAVLKIRPRPRLEWAGGGIDLFPVMAER